MINTIFTITLACIFSFFSTVVIGYIALATPIGPWIEMTLVLIGMVIFRCCMIRSTITARTECLALATAAGGMGAAIAMACSFSLPTLYFLDPLQFSQIATDVWSFSFFVMLIATASGLCGFLIALIFEQRLMNEERMVFPIGHLVYTLLISPHKAYKAIQLAWGSGITLIYTLLLRITHLTAARIPITPSASWNLFKMPPLSLRLDMIPLFLAIGFTTGPFITVPLLIALVSRIILIDPLHAGFFTHVSHTDYLLAFGAGMALQSALTSIKELPHFLHKRGTLLYAHVRSGSISSYSWASAILILTSIGIAGLFFTFHGFPLLTQLYLFIFTLLCTYQLMVIAGELGIAPLGRFATFVMMPGLLLFKWNALHITLVTAFVEIAGVVAVDTLFGKKVAQKAAFSSTRMSRYQLLGLVVGAISCGIMLWIFITHLTLGSPELGAPRAHSRALLIQAFQFDYGAMIIGCLFSYGLMWIHSNPMLVFGGLLMGFDISLMLIAGGLCAFLVADKEELYPFFSGIYAASSLWIFLDMLLQR